jgi:hypothetical protein
MAAAKVKIATNIASAIEQKATIERELLPELHDFFSKIAVADRHYRAISSPKTLLKIKANPILRRYLENLKFYDGDHAQAMRIKTLILHLERVDGLHSKLLQMMGKFTAPPVAAAAAPAPQRQAVGGAGAALVGDENEEVWEVNLTENAYTPVDIPRLANLERLGEIKRRINANPRLRRTANYEIATKAIRNEETRALTMFNKKSHRRSTRRITRRKR